jgi:hypothetical protein
MTCLTAVLLGRLEVVVVVPVSSECISIELGVSFDKFSSYKRLGIFLIVLMIDFRVYPEAKGLVGVWFPGMDGYLGWTGKYGRVSIDSSGIKKKDDE